MSKAVRIREHLYEEIAKRAKEERRSILNQLEVLLEQALHLDPESPRAEAGIVFDARTPSGAAEADTSRADSPAQRSGARVSAPADPHFKPDFK